MKKRFITWKYVEKAVNELASQITQSGLEFECVQGLARGGLIPAVLLSHKLGIPYCKDNGDSACYGSMLVVDDICDTGYTLEEFSEFTEVYTATIHYKPTAIVKPNFYYEEIKNEWIVYPWEEETAEPVPDYLNQ